MSKKRNIFITGVTGALGSQILKQFLLSDGEDNFFILIRDDTKHKAKDRFNSLLKWLFGERFRDRFSKNIRLFIGDVSEERFGLRSEEYKFLIKNTDFILHAAAITRFHDPISVLRATNVDGTQRILSMIRESKKPVELHYISTAFIAGDFKGEFQENDFDRGQKFNNPYEQSKFEAEKIVRKFAERGQKVCIYRPSIVVGEYKTGAILSFQMFYKPLYLLSKEVFDEIPIHNETLLNLIPVDIAAKIILTLADAPKSNNIAVYHVASPVAFNILHVIDLSSKYFNFLKPRLLKEMKFKRPGFAQVYEDPIKPFMDYFKFMGQFGCQKTLDTLKGCNFIFPLMNDTFLQRLFFYAKKKKYIEVNK